ncbi:MAG TPA: SDR family oxidoreductase [Anaerolineaceae bacterium]|nr:SDR family oxidoreductase [Anaerolineaceae bacterium]
MKTSWQNKTALITGASSGIGAAVTRRLAGQGLRVVLAARRLERLQSLADEIERRGGQAAVLAADLSQESTRLEIFKRFSQLYGCPDVLVNNAGFAYYGYTDRMPWSAARGMIDLNVTAAAHLACLFLPGMLARRSGHIINVGSVNGVMPSQGTALYSASKAFLGAFTTSLHRELRGSGVQASVVYPGPVATELFDNSEKIANGLRVPAEAAAISPETVADCVWSLLLRPRRSAYVPWYWAWTAPAEFFFGWAMDLVGPALLKR